MKVGYARVSSIGQNLQSQIDALEAYGCEKIFQEKESRDRQLKEEKVRKRREEKEAFQQEVELVQRLRDEMNME